MFILLSNSEYCIYFLLEASESSLYLVKVLALPLGTLTRHLTLWGCTSGIYLKEIPDDKSTMQLIASDNRQDFKETTEAKQKYINDNCRIS